jgi:hypothetical protein
MLTSNAKVVCARYGRFISSPIWYWLRNMSHDSAEVNFNNTHFHGNILPSYQGRPAETAYVAATF